MSPIVFIVLFLTSCVYAFICIRYNYSSSPSNVHIISVKYTKDTFSEKIAIGIVVCYIKNNTGPREEAGVLIKSAILSAQTYKIISTIEVYIFVEHLQDDTQYFTKMLEEFGQPFNDLDIRLIFISAFSVIPPIYQNEVIYGTSFEKFRCAKLRILFPSMLPHLDSILYLDTDIIITGNLAEIWNHFRMMDRNQLVGIANDYEDHSPRKSDWISKIPIPPPKGLNSGVLLMNLTKMREIDWETKLMRINKDYSKIADDLNDQQLINILLYFNSQLFLRLPCHFNFRAPHCDAASNCKSAADNGVHIVHGAASHFSKTGALHQLFLAYKNFSFKNCSANDLLTKVQKLFQIQNETEAIFGRNHKPSCTGVLDSLILKLIENLPNY